MKKYRLVKEYVDLYGRVSKPQGLKLISIELGGVYEISVRDGIHRTISSKDIEASIARNSGYFGEVKPERWRAEKGEHYFYISSYIVDGTAVSLVEDGDVCDNELFKNNNYFKTREQAEEASRRVIKVLSDYQDELLEI